MSVGGEARLLYARFVLYLPITALSAMARSTIKAAIIGGAGYTGAELLRLLAGHSGVQVVAVSARQQAGQPVARVLPQLRGASELSFGTPEETAACGADAVFFATPPGVAMAMAPPLLEAGARVVDLSPDFRLRDAALWEKWYGCPHGCPELLAEAVYGLTEYRRQEVAGARLVANPGCYPTAILLGLLPLLEAGAVEAGALFAAAASGLSGAGRRAEASYLLTEAGESMGAYAAAGHRHLPEIEQMLREADADAMLSFVPHLAPMSRGLHATLLASIRGRPDLQGIFEARYAGEPFVEVLPAGIYPRTGTLRGGNLCRLAVEQPQGRNAAVVLCAIDNLVKGAAGQAIQNMNLMFGCDETEGLSTAGLAP